MENTNMLYDKSKILDIRFMIGYHSAVLGVGNGIVFDCKDKDKQDFINQWIEKNYVNDKLFQFFLVNSIVGRAHLYLVPTVDGGLSIRFLHEGLNCRVVKVDDIEQMAEIYTMPYASDIPNFQRIRITTEYIEILTYEFPKNMGQVGINGLNEQIVDSLQPIFHQRYRNKTEGIIPLIETTNLPIPTMFGNTTLTAYPDTLPAYKMIEDANEAIEKKALERKLNHTWATGKFDPQTPKSEAERHMLNNAFMNNGMNDYTKGQDNQINIIPGDPKFDQYIVDLDDTLEKIFMACGYDYKGGGNVNYENKTKSLMNNQKDMETTLTKRNYYKTRLYRLFDYVFIHYGKWDGKGERPYKFDFVDSSFIDQIKQDEIINSRLANGTMSRLEAIKQYDQIPENMAEKILEKIDEELEVQQQKEIEHEKQINSQAEEISSDEVM